MTMKLLTRWPDCFSATAGQTTEGYNSGSGWSALADQCGVALLFPGQWRPDNGIGSFNWFKPSDSQSGDGGPVSIRQVIGHVSDHQAIDPSRILYHRPVFQRGHDIGDAGDRPRGESQSPTPGQLPGPVQPLPAPADRLQCC
ncbi:MAG: PHB depolymerase family esterase [Gemmobacter sp.]|nr:PHB depolymerase family esterase [Gemmobacter sp.]